MNIGTYLLLALIIFILIGIIKCVCIVPQSTQWIIETLGKYSATWEAGLHIKIPFIAKVVKKVSLKEQVKDFEPQNVITKDNVAMKVDSVVFFKVFDAYKFTYGVERPIAAIENLSATTLRNIIGSMTLDETLVARDAINKKITQNLDDTTDKWGITVTSVEVKDIKPPQTIQNAMEAEVKAEREKRALELEAKAQKQAQITLAEAEKESAILKADAYKERMVREAQGRAEALLEVQRATAQGIELINQAAPSAQYLQLEQYKAAADIANGQATKIIVPSDIASLVSNFTAIAEVARPSKPAQLVNQAPYAPVAAPQPQPRPNVNVQSQPQPVAQGVNHKTMPT